MHAYVVPGVYYCVNVRVMDQGAGLAVVSSVEEAEARIKRLDEWERKGWTLSKEECLGYGIMGQGFWVQVQIFGIEIPFFLTRSTQAQSGLNSM
jgi:hypothetical protein